MTLSDMSDDDVLQEVAEAGLQLLKSAQQMLAKLPPMKDDERWSAPIPLSFEVQLAVLFMGALDAYNITAGILRHRASQQAFNGLRFQLESLALIRWLTEPPNPRERQLRAYKVVCVSISRWAKFLLADAGRDKDALEGARRVRMWGRYLRELAADDGILNLKEPPDRVALLSKYGHEGGSYPTFSMLSELGSHPGVAGNLLFVSDPTSTVISYDFQGGTPARAYWSAAAIVHLWQTCEAVAVAFGWTDWLEEAKAVYEGMASVMWEALRRYQAERAGIGQDQGA